MAIGYLDSTYLTNIGDAIRAKAGTTDSYTVAQMPTAIQNIPAPKVYKDVNFIDWDGTLLYSYTLAEAQALEALPELPGNYKDYVAASWTETLSFVKNLTYPWMIGVNYTTQRSETYVYITVPEPNVTLGENLTVNWRTCSMDPITINWGDGNTEVIPNNSVGSHTYASAGDYVLTASKAPGKNSYQIGYITSGSCIYLDSESRMAGYGIFYRRYCLVRDVELGCDCLLGNDAFSSQINLTRLLIPSNIRDLAGNGTIGPFSFTKISFLTIPNYTGINYANAVVCYLPNCEGIILPSGVQGYSLFQIGGLYQNNVSLKRINWYPIRVSTYTDLSGTFTCCCSLTQELTIPEGFTSVYNFAAGVSGSPVSLSVKLPSTLTSIGMNAFRYNRGITTITIPASVTSIGNNAFNDSGVQKIIMESSTPCSLGTTPFGNSRYLTGCPQIYVPYGSLSTYQSASGWSSYASNIFELPQTN